jgi:RNase P/RNase MRP subunit POP5
LTAIKYVVSNKTTTYEMLAGISLHITEVTEVLRGAWSEVYSPAQLQTSLSGMLVSYKKKQIRQATRVTTNKKAVEAVFLALELLRIASLERVPPTFNAIEMLKSAHSDKGWIL